MNPLKTPGLNLSLPKDEATLVIAYKEIDYEASPQRALYAGLERACARKSENAFG
jgi:hypothetical protein